MHRNSRLVRRWTFAIGATETGQDIERDSAAMKMTRRQLVIATTSVGLTSALVQFRAPAATAARALASPMEAKPETELTRDVSLFSSDFSHRIIATVPLALPLTSSTPIEVGSTVRMTYDPRLYSVSDRAIVALRGSTAASAVTVLARSKTLSELSFTLPYGLGADRTSVGLPLGTPTLYPHDSVDSAIPVSLTVTDPTGAQIFLQSWPVRTDKIATQPWGVELTGAWDSFTVVHRRGTLNYRWPFLLNCTSVGPGAIPPGSRIAVSLDSHLVKNASIETVVIDGTSVSAAPFAGNPSRQHDELILPIVLAGGLSPGAQLAVQLSVVPTNGRRKISAVRNATATFLAPSVDATMNQRVTGKTTLSDTTNSGSALTPNSAVNVG